MNTWLGLGTGLVLLTWSAERFVDAAIALATLKRWSPLLVGSVVVGFATTFPEILVSFMAYAHQAVDLSIGNALGSYIANIGMVLGLTAMIQPIEVDRRLIARELPVLTLVYGLVVALLLDHVLSVGDGFIMIGTLVALLLGVLWVQVRHPDEGPRVVVEAHPSMSLRKSLGWLLVGLLGLVASSKLLIVYASSLARLWGVSELVIGLTIVAVGTSLPELAASIASVRRGEHDLALGNVIGSNIFGLLAIMTVPALLSPGRLSAVVIYRDLWAMGLMTLALWLVCMALSGRKATITRPEGAFLAALFAGYLYWTCL